MWALSRFSVLETEPPPTSSWSDQDRLVFKKGGVFWCFAGLWLKHSRTPQPKTRKGEQKDRPGEGIPGRS